MLASEYERPNADPRMVMHLTQAITGAIEQTCIPDVTSTADILSALFTTLDHILRVTQHEQLKEDQMYNSAEINRVLTNMLMQFGGSPVRH
mgnify:FL=1